MALREQVAPLERMLAVAPQTKERRALELRWQSILVDTRMRLWSQGPTHKHQGVRTGSTSFFWSWSKTPGAGSVLLLSPLADAHGLAFVWSSNYAFQSRNRIGRRVCVDVAHHIDLIGAVIGRTRAEGKLRSWMHRKGP